MLDIHRQARVLWAVLAKEIWALQRITSKKSSRELELSTMSQKRLTRMKKTSRHVIKPKSTSRGWRRPPGKRSSHDREEKKIFMILLLRGRAGTGGNMWTRQRSWWWTSSRHGGGRPEIIRAIAHTPWQLISNRRLRTCAHRRQTTPQPPRSPSDTWGASPSLR
jgi:hypothetical protein